MEKREKKRERRMFVSKSNPGMHGCMHVKLHQCQHTPTSTAIVVWEVARTSQGWGDGAPRSRLPGAFAGSDKAAQWSVVALGPYGGQ